MQEVFNLDLLSIIEKMKSVPALREITLKSCPAEIAGLQWRENGTGFESIHINPETLETSTKWGVAREWNKCLKFTRMVGDDRCTVHNPR